MMRRPATESAAEGDARRTTRYKGVRKRKWGKWVSEIRLPHSRERIWLGSYDTPEKAARAFDTATICLRGRGAGGFNFPDDLPDIDVPTGRPFSASEVQAAAARFANTDPLVPEEAGLAAAAAAGAHSPEVVASDETLTGESGGELDWSFMDLVGLDSRHNGRDFAGPFNMLDDFSSDFFPAPGPTTAPTDFLDENGAAAYGLPSFLWDF